MVGEPGFLFDPTGRSAPTYEELQKRRAIAHQLLMRRDKQPKNVGEGLTSIGEAIGDIGYNLITQRQAAAAQAYAAQHGNVTARPPPLAAPSYVPPSPAPPPAAPPRPAPGPAAEIDQSTTGSTGPASASAEVDLPGPVVGDTSGSGTVTSDIPMTPPDTTTTLPPVTVDETAPVEPTAPRSENIVQPDQSAEQLATLMGDRARSLVDPANRVASNAPVVPQAKSLPVSASAEADTSAYDPTARKVYITGDSQGSPVTPGLMKAIEKIESSGNPNAVTGSYKGLYQLSDEQFAKYGGQGDIFDPAENTRVAKLVIADEARQLSEKLGRPVTGHEVYLAHQQGFGGAYAHLTNPDQPAWKSMFSTAEGQAKGEGWAKKAIWGNVPDDVKARFGSVENMTSRDFTDMWKAKGTRMGIPDDGAAATRTAATGEAAGPLDYIAQHGGHASVLKDGTIVDAHPSSAPFNPELGARLAAAGKAYEQETGQKPKYGEMTRGEDVQQVYYDKYRSGTGGIAAAPGRSRHQHGEAMDIPSGGFRDWLYAGNMDKFGLHFPVKGDAPHVQMNPNFAGSFSGGDTQTAAAPAASPRERVAVAAMRNPEALSTTDREQEDRFADVMGMRGGGGFNYPTTALNRTGDIQSDAPDPGVSPAIAGQIAETLQGRRAAIAKGLMNQPQQQPAPQPPAPLSVADPAISTAPAFVDPRLAQKASAGVTDVPQRLPPGVPTVPPPMARPEPPQLVQPDPAYTNQLNRIANDPRLDPEARQRASHELDQYQSRLQHHNDQLLSQHNMYLKQYLEEQANLRNPQTVYDVERKKQELQYLPNEQRMKTEAHETSQAKAKQGLIPPPTSVAPGPPGSPTSAQRTGIPTLPANPGVSPEEWARLQAPLARDAIVAADKAEPQFKEAIKLLKEANAHPGREAALGLGGSIAQKVPGTSAYAFSKVMEQIGGKNFLTAYQSLKGGGSITEIEGSKAEAAQARLATAQSKEDFDKAMTDFEVALRQDLETAQRKVNRPVTAWQNTPDDPVAPDKGERRGNKEYIGGNPRDPQSWRTVK